MLGSISHKTSPRIIQSKKEYAKEGLSRKVLEAVALNTCDKLEMAKENGGRDGTGQAIFVADLASTTTAKLR